MRGQLRQYKDTSGNNGHDVCISINVPFHTGKMAVIFIGVQSRNCQKHRKLSKAFFDRIKVVGLDGYKASLAWMKVVGCECFNITVTVIKVS